MVETNAAKGLVEKVTLKEIIKAMQKIKSGKTTGPSEVGVKIIVTRRKIGVKVMMDLCQ